MSEQNNVNQEEKRHLTSAERQKLYQEKATERRIEEYKKRKRARITKIALLALAVLLLIGSIIAAVLLERNVWEPARIYKSANELYAAEEYLDAYEIYLSLGEYKDAAEIASTCITKNAQKLAGREDVIIGTSKSMPWFKIDENGAISFVEKKYKGAKEIIVPDVFDNILVMAVADKGFFYAPFESIILPPSIKRIEAQGFFACSSLKSIIAHFINNQQITAGDLYLQLQQAVAIQRLNQFIGQIRSSIESYIQALHTGFQSQCNGQMGLAGSWIANHDHILLLSNEVTAGQLPDLSFRHVFQIGEVKLLQCFGIRKPSSPDLSFPVAFLPVFQLCTHQRYQKIVKTFVTIQLPDQFFILVKGWYP